MRFIKGKLTWLILLITSILTGLIIFRDKFTNSLVMISFISVILVLFIFFANFENKKMHAKDIMPLAVMCTVASVGRAIFAFIPQVQPVTAIVIIMGVCFGKRYGFITGAISALMSNMLLGQGLWTVWQMLGWGTVGFIAGVFYNKNFKGKMVLVCIYAFISGFIYGFITDLWTVIFMSNDKISWETFAIVYGSATLFNFIHAVGNVVFMVLLYIPLCSKMERIKNKYGVCYTQ